MGRRREVGEEDEGRKRSEEIGKGGLVGWLVCWVC